MAAGQRGPELEEVGELAPQPTAGGRRQGRQTRQKRGEALGTRRADQKPIEHGRPTRLPFGTSRELYLEDRRRMPDRGRYRGRLRLWRRAGCADRCDPPGQRVDGVDDPVGDHGDVRRAFEQRTARWVEDQPLKGRPGGVFAGAYRLSPWPDGEWYFTCPTQGTRLGPRCRLTACRCPNGQASTTSSRS